MKLLTEKELKEMFFKFKGIDINEEFENLDISELFIEYGKWIQDMVKNGVFEIINNSIYLIEWEKE